MVGLLPPRESPIPSPTRIEARSSWAVSLSFIHSSHNSQLIEPLLVDMSLLTCKNRLTLECIQGLILLMVQSSSAKVLRSGALAKATGLSPDTIRAWIVKGQLLRH
jgi:hypothetical protein